MNEKPVEQDIINASMKIFIKKGKDGARMQEIADEAGVNKMLLHYYFKSKDLLFLEVVKKIVVDLYDCVIEESMNSMTFKEVLSVFIDRHFDFLNERKESIQFLLWELSRKELDLKEIVSGSYKNFGRNPFELLTFKLNEAIRKGEVRQVDASDFIINLFSLDLFLFAAFPIMRMMSPADNSEMASMIGHRKKEVFRLLWNDIENK
jgi:TetR/AcrR family transcriptional regulator